MTDTTDVTVEPNIADGSEPPDGGLDTVTVEPAARRTPMPKIGVWSWAFVGFTAAAVIVVIVLGAVSEIVLPMIVRRGAGHHLQTAGRRAPTAQAQAHPGRRRDRARTARC